MSEEFQLRNDPPAASPRSTLRDPVDEKRQRVLFAGLDCLPGQLDLFATDGEDPEGEPCTP